MRYLMVFVAALCIALGIAGYYTINWMLSTPAIPKIVEVGKDPRLIGIETHGRSGDILNFAEGLINEMAARRGFTVNYRDYTADQLFPQLDKGKVSAIITGRESPGGDNGEYPSVLFYKMGLVLVVRVETKYDKLEDIKNGAIGIPALGDDPYRSKVQDGVNLLTYTDVSQVLRLVANGEYQAVIADLLSVSNELTGTYQNTLKIIGPTLSDDGIRVEVVRGRGDKLLQAFSEGLKELMDDGTYDKARIRFDLPLAPN